MSNGVNVFVYEDSMTSDDKTTLIVYDDINRVDVYCGVEVFRVAVAQLRHNSAGAAWDIITQCNTHGEDEIEEYNKELELVLKY